MENLVVPGAPCELRGYKGVRFAELSSGRV
jgi:hypothetical protein